MKNQNAIIIPGPRKCGSTTLFEILDKHPQINSPLIKEPHYFMLNWETIKENINWYKGLYDNHYDKKILDASALYFSSDRALKNIKNFFNKTKILIILRDPAKRAYSAYWHMRKKVPTTEKRSFKYILGKIVGPENKKIKYSENNLLKEAIRKNQITKDYLDENYHREKHGAQFSSDFENPLIVYKYFQGSLYSERVEKIKSFFDDVKLIFLEKLIERPKIVIKDIFDFLKISEDKSCLELPHANPTGIPKNIFVKNIERIRGRSNLFRNFISSSNLTNRIAKKIHSALLNVFFEPKPKLKKEIYLETKRVLNNEFEYWYQKNSELSRLWCY